MVRSLQIKLFTLVLYITVTARHVKSRRLAACLRLVRFIILLQLMKVTQPIQMFPIHGLAPVFALFLESVNFNINKRRSSAYLQSSFLLSAYMSLIRPIDSSSKSAIERPNCTHRSKNHVLSFLAQLGKLFLDSTSVFTFSPHSSISCGKT